jgi:glyoxylase-like metal-dependent hydrolase (beta-lactamase superfamily II)
LNDNDTISLGNITLEVLHCPGHTPGHVVLVERTSNSVVVGDVIFAGSIGRTDFPQGNHQQLIDSIKQKIMVLPDDMTIYPGHGPTTTVGTEKATNPYVSGKFG